MDEGHGRCALRANGKKAFGLRAPLIAGQASRIHIGTSGWAYPQWKNKFYPTGMKDTARLTYYATRFNTIEINSSFYRLPAPAFISKWLSQVPEDFRLCFKAWRVITHDKRLENCAEATTEMLKILSPARTKSGPILFQLPPGLNAEALPGLESVLDHVSSEGWQAAVECRHASWYEPDVVAALHRKNVAIVRHDMMDHATPVMPLEKEFIYMRFHGAGVKYAGDYGDAFLDQLAARLREARETKTETYVFFNNTMGAATNNAARLHELMQEPSA